MTVKTKSACSLNSNILFIMTAPSDPRRTATLCDQVITSRCGEKEEEGGDEGKERAEGAETTIMI